MMDILRSAAVSTAQFMLETLPVVVAAIYAVNYSIKKGYVERMARHLKPMLKKLGVSEFATISFVTCFISPTASYSMVSQAWREGKVENREVIAISFLNSFPSVFSHLYSYFVPFVIPVLGFAGVVYTALRFAVAVVKTLLGLFLSRKWNNPEVKLVEIKQQSPSQNILRITLVMAVTYFCVSILSLLGFFNAIGEMLNFIPLRAEALTIAIVEFFNIRSVVVLSASLMESGLHWKWAVVGLMLGNVVSFSTRSVKHSLPLHLSLFGSFGVKIVLLNSLITLILDVVIILFLLLV